MRGAGAVGADAAPWRGRAGGDQRRYARQRDVEELLQCSAQARADARAVLHRSRRLVGAAARLTGASHEAVLASRPRSRYAWIEGVVDGAPTRAAVRRDASAVTEAPLRRRLELLEALGETDASGRPLAPGRQPLDTTLLVVRACDEVRSVTFADGPSAMGGDDRVDGVLGQPADG